jgi:hypothetical protein
MSYPLLVGAAYNVVSFCTFSFTDQPISLSAAISLSSIIKEMPQNYNSYIQAFREKDGIHGHQVRLSFRKKAGVGPRVKGGRA